MVTIRRHPVPADSYDPKRPLNDLLAAQFEHFRHIAETLAPEVRGAVPAPQSANDREGVDRFIAAITSALVSRKREKPRLVKPVRRRQPGTLDIAAAVGKKPKRSAAGQSKSRARRGRGGGLKP